ncbi:MAG: hypothetical protein EBX37_13980 [Alphaproteobacteria bacterium]|nr:hypothetical protein [Alphaproteobacteria bacterium]
MIIAMVTFKGHTVMTLITNTITIISVYSFYSSLINDVVDDDSGGDGDGLITIFINSTLFFH